MHIKISILRNKSLKFLIIYKTYFLYSIILTRKRTLICLIWFIFSSLFYIFWFNFYSSIIIALLYLGGFIILFIYIIRLEKKINFSFLFFLFCFLYLLISYFVIKKENNFSFFFIYNNFFFIILFFFQLFFLLYIVSLFFIFNKNIRIF